MVATIHRVSAGNGYQYYLRNIAANDTTARGRSSLADYYSAHGEAPGRWQGSGLTALDILPGSEVTEAQMQSLFGLGIHPNAEQIEDRVYAHQISLGSNNREATRAAEKASKLGRSFAAYKVQSQYRNRCSEAFRAHNFEQNLPPTTAVPDDERARIRTRVATEMFTAEYERAPSNTRELSGWVAKNSRPKHSAVAGFDITFSPVKSVSVLWALAPSEVSRRIEAAHRHAIEDAVSWLERNAIFTRLGRNGIRQVDVEGVVAAAFTHRDSRAGDPDLHTHLLIANRARALDGKWRTIDSRTLHEAVVTASEIYDSRLEHHLETDLALQFEARPGRTPEQVQIREIVGVPVELIEAWSQRGAAIIARLDQLTAAFQTTFGREPSPSEVYDLSDRATLETRPSKHLSASLAEQRATWATQARHLFAGRDTIEDVVTRALSAPSTPRPEPDAEFITAAAERALAGVSARRSTWRVFNLRAEVERQLRGQISATDWTWVPERVVAEATAPPAAVARGDPDLTEQPSLRAVSAWLGRRDSAAVHVRANSQIYTTESTLDVETALIELSVEPGARVLDPDLVAAAVSDYNTAHPDRRLNAGQVGVISAFATSGLRIHTANAPAGTGKTTAVQVLTSAWHSSGGTVLGMAPTAAAAAVLGESIGTRAETVDKLLDVIARHTARPDSPAIVRDSPPSLPQWVLDIDNTTLVIVDEHVKLSNTKRLRLLQFLSGRGATVRCIGDDRQLPAIEAGGSDADMNAASPEQTLTLSHVVRFASTGEATASIGLREADPAALAWYLDNDRIHAGHSGSVYDDTYQAWTADVLAGRDAIMLAPTHEVVTALNARARADRLTRTGAESGPAVVLADGLLASIGDIVRTRRNDPRLRFGAHDWVRNGYAWTVTGVHDDGSLTVSHRHRGADSGETVRLPGEYVRHHVRLGYASTIDSAQGITADTGHVALSGRESRQQLYVAMTRGIHANHAYIVTALDGAEGAIYTEPATYPRTAIEILQRVMARDGAQTSAHTALRDALDPSLRIGRAVDIYLDTLGLAAEHALGAGQLDALDRAADTVHPNLTDSPAYPVLRQHLALIALTGADPLVTLRAAADRWELDTAADPAAVLDWRLDPAGTHSAGAGPLAWTPGLPNQVLDRGLAAPVRAREQIVAALAAQIRDTAQQWTPGTAPAWARPLLGTDPALLGELAVWRAGLHIADTDPRPTGPTRYTHLERTHQRRLEQQIIDAHGDPALPRNRWAEVVDAIDSRITTDTYWPLVADKIDLADRAGLDITTLLTDAAAHHALPDEMPAAALWARLELEPSALDTIDGDLLRPEWLPDLEAVLGTDMTEQIITEPAWPRVVAAVERASITWATCDLLSTAYELLQGAQPDDTAPLRPDQLAAALAWRIDVLHHHTPTAQPPTSDPTPSAPEPARPADNHDQPPITVATEGPAPSPTNDALTADTDPRSTDGDPANRVEYIAHLFASGHVSEAVSAFRTFRNELSEEQHDIVTAVAETLYRNSFPVARARLRWAAEQFPHHRALIKACTPATDPHTFHRDGSEAHRARSHPVYDHREHIDPTLTPAKLDPVQAAGNDAFDTYLDNTQTLADHEPTTADRSQPSAGVFTLDYDLAAIPALTGLPCVDCSVERPRNASIPVPPRTSDDGLCHSCRDNKRPGIPAHNPTEHLTARCAHIAETHPAPAALAMLRRDWRALDPAGRTVIQKWLADHPITEEQLPILGPLQRLSEQELTDAIDGLTQRLSNIATEAEFLAPTRHDNVGSEPDPTTVSLSHDAYNARHMARMRADELDNAIRRLRAASDALATAREELDALPLMRRAARNTIQTRINTLTREHRQLHEQHRHARNTARAANRHANELNARAEHAAAAAEAHRREDQARATADNDAARNATIEALQHGIESELRAHQTERRRRNALTSPQRHQEERARIQHAASADEFAVMDDRGIDHRQPGDQPGLGL
ncbi:MobF family relaxase [Nocardia ignorata]|uniref:Conjugative relaxase-like TrwC/TraI family protein n=1 Tax=Nocardia ignorata TaxID=145285 RepID=A0A4R6NWY8_NOCIG|nr:MobF family relaxase [Nocardia ignorata]TDP28238.1 conjugative relaxase-like TrwC/TraI family protein [Nocardia ignorata]